MKRQRAPHNRRNKLSHQVALGTVAGGADQPSELWRILFARILCGLYDEGADAHQEVGGEEEAACP